MNQTLTDWFPPETKPVHVGVYQTVVTELEKHDTKCWFQYWNGRRWGISGNSPRLALSLNLIETGFTNVEWRGIAK